MPMKAGMFITSDKVNFQTEYLSLKGSSQNDEKVN